ncbi:MAG: DUF4145 domain-containing protein [Oleispira sp.]|nr:DUF4145 domain-containing protein [Oleispira sp.]
MTQQYTAPKFNQKVFTCPNCSAIAAMDWRSREDNVRQPSQDLYSAQCHGCSMLSIWLRLESAHVGFIWKMIHPNKKSAPLPSPDLPDNCMTVYMEARDIADLSPSGAAALLRLCIDHLCLHLGATQDKLNGKIKHLVEQGLPVSIQKALDSVRVIGNDAVHPGKLDIGDTAEIVTTLFKIVNIIVNNQITQPNEIDGIHSLIPENQLKGIAQRDAKAKK